MAEIERLRGLLREALDSRAPDYVPGDWYVRARAAVRVAPQTQPPPSVMPGRGEGEEMGTETQAEIWTNGVAWAAQEIDALRSRLEKTETDRRQDYDALRREIAYLQRRAGPIMVKIDRGNYDEAMQIMHPLDQERVRAMVMGLPTPSHSPPPPAPHPAP